MNKVLTNNKPNNEMSDDVFIYDEMGNEKLSSNKINVFGRNQNQNSLGLSGYNPQFIKNLRKQFDDNFLSKLVDIYNTMSNKKASLNDIDNVVEFLIEYSNLNKKKYLYTLLFPETGLGVRIPTKFPLPSATFKQRTFFTISPNSSGNWFLQWCPQTLLSSSYSTANTGDLLLNNSLNLTGSSVDSTAANYTPITVTRLLAGNLIQAYRLVSASIIIEYQGSIDSHSGMIGGGVDVSYIDSLQPDTSASQFSVIDDKMWRCRGQPFDGLRLIYFPKDYADLNFIRTDVSTQNNGIPTCMRFLMYGQNLPAGSSCKVELIRNFEMIPLPGMADFVNMDYLKPMSLQSMNGEPALEAGSKIAEKQLVVTQLNETDKLKAYAESDGNMEMLDDDSLKALVGEDSKNKGGIGDIATWLGKSLLQTTINSTLGSIPVLGAPAAGMVNTGIDMLSNQIKKLYN